MELFFDFFLSSILFCVSFILSVIVVRNMQEEGRVNMCSAEVNCKKCKTKVVNFVKCVICGNCYHKSCAKTIKSEILDKATIRCCETAEVAESDNVEFFDAIQELSSNNKIDIHIFKYVVRQKDALINELKSQILVLEEQVAISHKNTVNNGLIVDTKTDSSVVGDKSAAAPPGVNFPHDNSDKRDSDDVVDPVSVSGFPRHMSVDSPAEFLRPDVSMPVDNKFGVNVSKDEWKNVHRRKAGRRRALVVGNFAGDETVEGVERTVSLHVSNLKPNTTEDELTKFLIGIFPEVKCERLKSRHPEYYSSFRVELNKSNYEKAMLPQNWPNRASVRNFFQRRRSMPVET